MSSVTEGLTLAVSVLEAVNPELSHSGSISCSASISYRQANGDVVTISQVNSRTLTVLGMYVMCEYVILYTLFSPFIYNVHISYYSSQKIFETVQMVTS